MYKKARAPSLMVVSRSVLQEVLAVIVNHREVGALKSQQRRRIKSVADRLKRILAGGDRIEVVVKQPLFKDLLWALTLLPILSQWAQ